MKFITNILSACVIALMSFCTVSASAEDLRDDPQAAEEFAVPAPQIKVLSHKIEIEIADDDSHQVCIYALTGQIVKTVEAANGTTSIDLPAGYYIVRIDNLARRVIIR